MHAPLLLIANLSAAGGQSRSRLESATAALRAAGARFEVRETKHPGHAIELAREQAPGRAVIAAAGGDGTVNEVAHGLRLAGDPRARLGIVPLGTGNDVATQLGLPTIPQAVRAIVAGETRKLDLIEVGLAGPGGASTRHALVFAAVGLAGDLLRLTTPAVKRWFGRRLSYSVGFFRALYGFRAPWLQLTIDGTAYAGRFLHVSAGNAEWAGGGMMRLSPGARMDDGWLEFCLVADVGRWGALRCFPRLLRGTHPSHPKVQYFRGRQLTLEAAPATEVLLDGDPGGRTPATFTIQPAALEVVVPPREPA
ncbi:MAG: diacylglycerol kinase family lipid kinase [Verrucomicrobia bacterium]|nr:diacylglycerol kinase family lipid kinase [Verrucomicrobiota bacterium]